MNILFVLDLPNDAPPDLENFHIIHMFGIVHEQGANYIKIALTTSGQQLELKVDGHYNFGWSERYIPLVLVGLWQYYDTIKVAEIIPLHLSNGNQYVPN